MRKTLPLLWLLLASLSAAAQPTAFNYIQTFSSETNGQAFFSKPRGMVVDGAGNLYVVDSETHRVKKFDSNGNFLKQFGAEGATDGAFRNPYDIAIDGTGLLYVTDPGNFRVQVFDTSGVFIRKWGSQGVSDGQFAQPSKMAIAVDNLNFIYVSEDFLNARIQKFSALGAFVDKWGNNTVFAAPSGIAIGNSRIYVTDSVRNQVSVFFNSGTIDTVLTTFGAASFAGPTGVAVDPSGNVFIAQQGTPKLIKLSSSLDSLQSIIANLAAPSALAIDNFGNVYTADLNLDQIRKHSNSLVSIVPFGQSSNAGARQLSRPTDVVKSPLGPVIIADAGNNRLQVFTPEGIHVTSVGGPGANNGQFQQLLEVAVDRTGNIYTVDSLRRIVQRFSPSFQYDRSWQGSAVATLRGIHVDSNGINFTTFQEPVPNQRAGFIQFSDVGSLQTVFDRPGTGSGQLTRPFGITRDANGNYYLTDPTRNKVLVFDANRAFVREWGVPGAFPGQFNQPMGIAVDRFGFILVVDHGNHRVLRFNPNGTLLSFFGGLGSRNDQLNSPTGIAVDPAGRIYIADTGNDRIQVIEACLERKDSTVIICQGDTVRFNNQNITVQGSYEAIFRTMQGCDSILTLNVTVLPTDTTRLDSNICRGSSVQFNNLTLDQTGIFYDTLTTVGRGCDSILQFNLTVNDTFRIATAATICRDTFYSFGNMQLTMTGVYQQTLQSSQGCDSTVTLSLSVLDTFFTQRFDTICRGEQVVINNTPYNAGGIYEIVFPGNNNRCDSVVELNLTVLDTFYTQRFDTICRGEVLQVGVLDLVSSGRFSTTFPRNDQRCDSTVEINLVVLDTFYTVSFDTICRGDTLIIDDNLKLFQPGTYTYTFPPNTRRCDSTVEIHLTVLDTFYRQEFLGICEGEVLAFEDLAITAAGRYFYVYPANQRRCDSVIEINVTLLDTFSVMVRDTICRGDTMALGVLDLFASGTYTYTFPPNERRCDSTVQVQLTVLDTFRTILTDTICSQEVFRFEDLALNRTGVYEYVYPANAFRCDSVIEIRLTVFDFFLEEIDTTICEGITLDIEGRRISNSGRYAFPYVSQSGCDSIVVYNVTVLDTFSRVIFDTICVGETYRIENTQFTTPGRFLYTFPRNERRCDSVIELHLTVLDTFRNEMDVVLCEGEFIQLGPQSITQGGRYEYTFPPNERRCDSTVILNVTLIPPKRDTVEMTICNNEELLIGGQVINRSGRFDITLQASTGCDSLLHLVVTELPTSQTLLNERICEGDSILFGGVYLDSAGLYLDTIPAVNGCDSIIRLNLTVDPTLVSATSATICAGEVYNFSGMRLTETGVYRDSFNAQTGCYFILELDLKVAPQYRDTTVATICAGDTLQFEGTGYTQSGFYVHAFQSVDGCDSIRYLDLTVSPVYRQNLEITNCLGDTFYLGARPLTQTGVYADTFQTAAGCDSIVTVNLRIGSRFKDSTTVYLCAGESYQFGNRLLDHSGLFRDTFQTVDGCDSISIVNLIVEEMDTTVSRGGILLTANADDVMYQWVDCTDTSFVTDATDQFFIPPRNGDYAVILSTGRCLYMSACENVVVTGTSEPDISAGFRLFPNPSIDRITVSVEEGDLQGQYEAEIIDLRGRVMRSGPLDLFTPLAVDISMLPPGMYWLRLRHPESPGVARLRFLKMQ